MKYKVGEVLHFRAEDLAIVVTMVGETGVRYYDPRLPIIDSSGNVITQYASNEWLEDAESAGTISNLTSMTMGEKEATT